MTKHRFLLPLAALLLGLLLLLAITYLPLSKEYRLLAPNDLTLESFLLTPGQTIKQTYLPYRDRQSGIRIFTYAPVLTDQQLSVQITDKHNQVLATGRLSNQTLQTFNDMVILDYSFSWLSTTASQPLALTLSLATGSQLPLNISITDTYHHGSFYINGVKQNGDLALATIHPQRLSAQARSGALAGIIFIIALAGIITFLSASYQWLAAAILLVIITPLALLGFFFSTGDLGIADWDLYFSYHEVIRRTVLNFHVFPFWNPWLCGGTAALGDPEFPLFTLTFLLELIFGIPTGFPLAIYLSIAVTAVGLLCLAKRLRLSLLASLLVALAGAFGGVTIIEIVEGHPNVFAAMWIPWIFWAWYNAYASNPKHQAPNPKQIPNKKISNKKLSSLFGFWISDLFRISNFEFSKWSLLCGLFLALTFYAGGIYLLMYTALAFTLITFLVARPLHALLTTIKSALWALGLAALKLLPVLFWLSNYPDKIYAGSAFSLPYLTQILFGRHLHGSNIILNQASGWHEYGAYIGYFVIALAVIGLSRLPASRIVRALFVAATAAILLSSIGPALQPYFDQLPFLPRSNISRFILFGIIPISFLAGYGLDRLLFLFSRPTPSHSSPHFLAAFISLSLLSLIAIDLFSFSSQLSSQAFVLPQVILPPSPAPYPLAYTAARFDQHGDASRTTRAYAAILQGYGTMTYCSVLGPDPMVRTIHDEVDNGLLIARPAPASLTLLDWNPNQAVFQITATSPAHLILNANAAPGWQAQSIADGLVQKLDVIEDSGRVAAAIPPGTQTVSFSYHTRGFLLGLIITLATLVLAAFEVYSKNKH